MGQHAHGRRARSGHQLVEWAQVRGGPSFSFVIYKAGMSRYLGPPEKLDRTSHRSSSCRSRDQRFWGSTKVLFEETLGESWSAYTDHNLVDKGVSLSRSSTNFALLA